MNPARVLGSLVLLAAVPSFASAQTFETSRFLGENLLGPPSAPAHAVQRCFAGELTGDARRDALLLVDGDVHLVWAPGGYEALPRVATGATDLALVRRAGPGNMDAFATVGTAGLRLHGFDAATGSFAASGLGGSAWIGASRVRAFDLGAPGGIEDLVGLDAAGLAVLLVEGVTGSVPVESSFALAAAATDVRAVDWAGTSAREIAVLGAASIGIHRPTGQLIATVPLAGPLRAWTTLPNASAGHQRLALVVETGGADVLQIASFGAPITSVPLGAQGVLWIEAVDLDLDGDEDLLLTRSSSGRALFLLQRADGLFDTSASFDIDLGAGSAPAGLAGAGIALADFDDDVDPDLLAPVPALGALSLVRNGALDADLRRPDFGAQRFVLDHTNEVTELELEVRVPNVSLPGATHVEVTAWRQEQAVGGPQHAAVARLLVPSAEWPVSADMPFANLGIAEHVHAFEAREVVLDSQGKIVAASSPSYVAFSASLPLLEAFSLQIGLPYASVVVFVPFVEIPVDPEITRLDTGIVPMGDVPKFEDEPEDAIPDPKPGD